MSDLPFSCSCGAISGSLLDAGPKAGDRYVCYCDDCRDFTRYLGRANDVLDSAGGTSVYQTRVGKLHLSKGAEHLACVNMTGQRTLRWFCAECRTPLFNTMINAHWPFLSMITAACDPQLSDTVLGPPRGSVFAEFATGPVVVTPPVSAFAMIRRVIVRLLADKFSGAGKHYPLFDPETREPIAEPLGLTQEEKHALGRT